MLLSRVRRADGLVGQRVLRFEFARFRMTGIAGSSIRPGPTDRTFGEGVGMMAMGTELLAEIDISPETFSDFGGFPAEIDRYQIIGMLGTGSMGVVLRAFDGTLGREVALKVLRLDVACRSDVSEEESRGIARARFVHEAQLMARLNHVNVVPIYDVGTWGEHVYLAMELIDGETLDRWLEGDRTREEIVDVFQQAAQGLEAAHRAGIVHRDFKPNNVLVGRDGRVTVMDLGLAEIAGECSSPRLRRCAIREANTSEDMALTQVGMSVGTPAYMPPEQHYGRCLDGRSDQFAFCCALHEALHGVRAFAGSHPDELLHNKLAHALVSERSVPRWLTKVVRRGTDPDPEARYASMRELSEDLGRTRRRTLIRNCVLGLATMATLAGTAVPLVALCL